MTVAVTGGWRRLGRAARHLRVRVTAAATLAAVVFAIAGAVVFVVLFDRTLLNNTDAALTTVTGQLAPELAAASRPMLAPASPTGRTTVIQLIDPAGGLRQTVTSSRGLDPTVVDGRTVLADAAQIAAARSGTAVFTRHAARVVLTPVPRADGTWVVLAAADLEQVNDAASDAQTAFLVVVPVVVLAIAGGAWLLSGAVLRPVERIRVDAATLRRRVGAGSGVSGGQVRVPDSGDSIEDLARTLNQLLADLTGAADRQRDLIADAGHELRTPLSVLRTELELADRPHRTREDLFDAVRHAGTEVDRLTALANDLLLLADAERRAVGGARPEDLAAIVHEAVRAHRAVAAVGAVELTVSVSGDPAADIDRDAYRRAVDNLLGNAIGVGAGHVDVTVAGSATEVVTTVDDDGPGFDPAFLAHAFDRFTRADASRHRTGAGGAGLGLAIVAAVADAHGGRATATNTAQGARVTVTVPRHAT